MPQSLSNVLLHLVFSTKNREPLIDEEIEDELFAYIGGICRDLKCPMHKIGAADDHIHIACSLARTIKISKLLEEIKKNSSKWIKTKGTQYETFAWQGGYGDFSIGQSQLPDLKGYISRQREHHKNETYKCEFQNLLARYEVEYDERYVWD